MTDLQSRINILEKARRGTLSTKSDKEKSLEEELRKTKEALRELQEKPEKGPEVDKRDESAEVSDQ